MTKRTMTERRMTVQNTRQERSFFKTYHDFLYNDLLNGEEKIIFVALKSFLDFSMDKNGTKGEAFPTIKTLCEITKWSDRKVIKVINNLVKKNVVKKVRRGLTKSNLYIIADYKEIWTAENTKEVKEVVENDKKPMTAEDYITELKKMGYDIEIKKTEPASASNTTTAPKSRKTEPASASNTTTAPENRVAKEKELVSGVDQTSDTNSHQTIPHNDTTNEPKSQERYTIPFLRMYFNYWDLVCQNPSIKTDIDIIFNLLYDTLNTQKPTIRVNGEDKERNVVIGRLMKLEFEDFPYVVKKYHEQTGRIKNVKAYLLTILYHAREQSHLDMMNLGHYNGDF